MNPIPTIVGLMTSGLWAFSSTLFQDLVRVRGPLSCNLFKTVFALLLFSLTLGVLALRGEIATTDRDGVLLLMLSGAVGMTFGDFAYFAAIQRLGVRTATLLHATAAVWLLLGEWVAGALPASLQVLGVVLVVAGVMGVTRFSGRTQHDPPVTPEGVIFGLLAAGGQAGGVALMKVPLAECDFTWATTVRLAGATLAFVVGMIVVRRHRWGARVMSDGLLWRRGSVATVFGTWIGLGLMTLTIKLNESSVAGALLSTTPIFVVFLALLRREKVGLAVGLAVAVGCAGIALIQLGAA